MVGNQRETSNTTQYHSSPELLRHDFTITRDESVSLAVRQVLDPRVDPHLRPVLLLHGARAAGIASFDLDLPGGSLAADLASAGHPVFLMDAHNYRYSSREPAMDLSPDQNGPLTRSDDVVRDIDAVTASILDRRGTGKVAAIGWATGGQWLAHCAATFPTRVSHLALLNSIWPVAGEWSIGANLGDPERPGETLVGALSAYGYATESALLSRWEDSIPHTPPDTWRDPKIAHS